MIAVDDGLFQGNFNAADVAFLIAVILFAVAAVIALAKRPDPSSGALTPLGLACVAFGLLLL